MDIQRLEPPLIGMSGRPWPIAFEHMPLMRRISTGTPSGAWPRIGRPAGPSARCVGDTKMQPCGALIQLRLLAGLFRLVLTGKLPN
jgi:hypothetical protein